MKVRCFTKDELLKAASIAEERDYNRQIDPNWVENHVDDDLLMPVVFNMIHEHRAGVPVDPHIRAMIVTNEKGDRVLLDVDWKLFHNLSVVEMPDKKRRSREPSGVDLD